MLRKLPSPETLRKLLRYDPDTGKLYWLERNESWFPDERAKKIWNTRFAGKEAFTADSHGYKQGSVLGVRCEAHVIIWSMVYGELPDQIDHVDRDKSNNRLSNLRDGSNGANNRNLPRFRTNTSGVTGVTWNKGRGRWQAQIHHIGECVYLGLFPFKFDAILARLLAEKKFGFHPNHGRVTQ